MFQNVPECFMFQVLSTPGDKTQNPKHSRTFWNMKKVNIFFIKKLLHLITIIINNNNNNNNKIKIIIIIIIIIVNYNYHKKIFQNPDPLQQFFKTLYNFDNFIHRRLSDHNKITFAIKYLPMSHLR